MEVSLLQAFENIEVVALDINVLGVVEINAVFTTRAKRGVDRRIGKKNRLALVGPGKLVAFRSFRHHAIRKILLEFLKIDQALWLTASFVHGLRNAVGKQLSYLRNVVLNTIATLHF